jgi:UDP-N-acetylmuramate: L-alanyl-gamma-D-glutamyl-meso-diaminopimelate ligase
MMRLIPDNGLLLLNGDDEHCLDVYAKEGHAPGRTVGFSDSCDARITEVEYGIEDTSFSIDGEGYTIPMNGEFNVRNASMAIMAARFGGLKPEEIREGLSSFLGVKRRQEVRGVTDRNITVVDDFGHHPTAIRQAIIGLRKKYVGSRLWAIFEPRSNTTRRKVFQESLPEALSLADAVCVAEVARADMLSKEERLDPDKVMEDIRGSGTSAFYEPGADSIVKRMEREALDGDVVIVFSNGGFDGIHDKLLDRL